jgi:hypothetical protein
MTYVGIGEAWDVDPPWTITKVMRLEFWPASWNSFFAVHCKLADLVFEFFPARV